MQGERNGDRAFDDSIVQGEDGERCGQTASGDDNRIGNGGVFQSVARGAADGEVNRHRGIGCAKTREGELPRIGTVLGRVKIAGVNPNELIVVLNCHRGRRGIGHAVVFVVGKRKNDGLLALNDVVVHRDDRQ